MTHQLTLTADSGDLSLELAAAAPVVVDTARRRIYGTALPAGGGIGTAMLGGKPTRVRFLPGSLSWHEDVSRVKHLRDHDRGRSVGVAASLSYLDEQARDGLRVELAVAEGPDGDAALRDAQAKTHDGLSVGAFDLAGSFDSTGVFVVSAGVVREISQVALPAFDDARIGNVAASTPREREHMLCTICGQQHALGVACPTAAPTAAPAPVQASAGELLTEIRDLLASGQITPTGPAPAPGTTEGTPAPAGLDLYAFAELVVAHNSGADVGDELRAALADIVPANSPNAFRPEYLDELWDSTDYQRKFIDNATTVRPLRKGLKMIGHRWVTKPTVDDYAGNKTDVPSGGAVLEEVEVPVKRLAGADDVDRAHFDLGSPEWLASYFEAQAEVYREKSDARAATQAWTDAAALVDNGPDATPATFSTLLEGVVAGVVDLATIGQGVDYVAMAPGLIAELLGITQMEAPAFFGGSFQLGNQGDGNLGGVTWFTTPGLPAGGFMLGRKTAVRFHEFEPPVRVQAVNVAKGGIDLGVFGYYATYMRNRNQVRKGTVGA